MTSGRRSSAAAALVGPSASAIKDRDGIYFFEQPLSQEGRLAFLFPGVGAAYINMLSDLCLHFPGSGAALTWRINSLLLVSTRPVTQSDHLSPPILLHKNVRRCSNGSGKRTGS